MKKCSIMLFLFAVISCAFLYGADSADTDFQTLGQIDSIIKRTEYDTALFELNKYLKSHPEQFDRVQQRIKKSYAHVIFIPALQTSFLMFFITTLTTAKN